MKQDLTPEQIATIESEHECMVRCIDGEWRIKPYGLEGMASSPIPASWLPTPSDSKVTYVVQFKRQGDESWDTWLILDSLPNANESRGNARHDFPSRKHRIVERTERVIGKQEAGQ